jgi:drug/metabolite transporter (DMT)-like permease
MEATTTTPQQANRLGNGWFVLAALIPVAGIVLAIIEWAKGNTGRGFAFATTATLAFVIYFAIACGAAVSEYDACAEGAQNVAQLSNC